MAQETVANTILANAVSIRPETISPRGRCNFSPPRQKLSKAEASMGFGTGSKQENRFPFNKEKQPDSFECLVAAKSTCLAMRPG